MKLTEMQFNEAQPVDGYGPGYFRIGGQRVDGGILLTASKVRSWEGYADVENLLSLQGNVDVIFIGTGAEISHLPTDLRERIEKAGMGVEIMNSPAACRTYNVLAAEGRRVALAALPV
ncbi:Mth938-like domain-containing protein [Lentibacter sp. XHP0401]|uniref:Mth938-like domain-containing protein n=1 Tax=Lentibacter sp. XHP0401 TaxID=2984334 RepID=UPI0021E9417A|nr:Mth938-like domain-containing protein [Lentibacter sp. XHP0401]MCV2891802.1 Mth938-like domain-containing protein [Lentibacter sp. XHP0401]